MEGLRVGERPEAQPPPFLSAVCAEQAQAPGRLGPHSWAWPGRWRAGDFKENSEETLSGHWCLVLSCSPSCTISQCLNAPNHSGLQTKHFHSHPPRSARKAKPNTHTGSTRTWVHTHMGPHARSGVDRAKVSPRHTCCGKAKGWGAGREARRDPRGRKAQDLAVLHSGPHCHPLHSW